jgi:diguanylate cyclase (GGDEF)-like protein
VPQPLIAHAEDDLRELEPGRVLYVEGDETLRDSFTRSLVQRGIGVDTAKSRGEALELLERNAYPVIVTDLALPDGDGVTLVHELRSVQPDASFIITTGFEVEYRAQGGLDDSIACFLKKPWSEAQLASAVDDARASYRIRRSSHAPASQHRYAVLLVEDEAADAEHLLAQLEHGGVCSEIKHCQTLAHATSLLRSRVFDAVMVDLGMVGAQGNELLQQLKAAAPEAALLVLSDHEHQAANVMAVRNGAQDFLIKRDTDVELMRRALQHAIERKHQERKLSYLAHHDPLTQLANRTAFMHKLEDCLAAAQRAGTRCAVMFLDLDGFKQVNDAHGHEAGDTVLCEVARRIQASVREEDMVARLGGDEFAVLLDQIEDAQVCMRVAQRILDIAGLPVLLREDVETCVRASVGIAVCPDSAHSIDALLRAADAAMYSAKARGGGYQMHGHGDHDAPERDSHSDPPPRRTG